MRDILHGTTLGARESLHAHQHIEIAFFVPFAARTRTEQDEICAGSSQLTPYRRYERSQCLGLCRGKCHRQPTT
jgi:hypothetical protein